MNLLVVQPAYGRRYTSPEIAKQDFLNGRDFATRSGPTYVSIREFLRNIPELSAYDGIHIVQVVPLFMSIVILRKHMKEPQPTNETSRRIVE
jgi:hypothetical protein